MILPILIIVNIVLWYTIRREPVLEEVKERYRTLREHLEKTDEPKFRMYTTKFPSSPIKGLS